MSTLLTREEEVELFKKIEAGDRQSRDKIILCNVRLAMYIAKKKSRFGNFADLLQAAYIGLITAVDRFEWKRGYRFSTYAFWWINQTVTREMENSTLVHEPSHVTALRKKADNLHMSDEDVIKTLGVHESALARARHTGIECVSIDEILQLEAETADVDTVIDTNKTINLILEIISNLPAREEQIIRLRYGIADVERRQFIVKDHSELVYMDT